ncbi:hypothetical protein [Agathobaculum desmolans]|uniref:hypothetical protein n=1 Tax=Agathobaculum desmolans TaxID=39484 RepID=UPI00248F455A|nr:hypothetical protein [Agathobaculum desmolans]
MKIKVILEESIVTDVLRDSAQGPSCEVEIIDINRDYPDYAELCAYRSELYQSDEYKPANWTVASFRSGDGDDE